MFSSEICTASLEDHLLVAHGLNGNIHLLNPTATMVWRCVEDGFGATDIASALADSFGLSLRQASADVEGILDQWQKFELMPNAAIPSSLRTRAAESEQSTPAEATLVYSRDYFLGPQAVTICYLAAPQATSVEFAHIDRVASLFSGFVAPVHTPTATVIRYVVGANVSWINHRGVCQRFQTTIEGFYGLGSTLLCQVYGPQDWLCRIHAAIVACGVGAIALPAPTGHGKSTLAAYLAARGWSYFGDDSTAIDPFMRALPLPTAISVKAGSVGVLQGIYPHLPDLPEQVYGAKRVRYLALGQKSAAVAPLPVAALVFPTYVRPGNTTDKIELRRLTPVQSATRLMQAGLNLGDTLSAEKLAWVAAFAKSIPAWSLSYSSLPEAEARLRSIGGK